VGLCRGEEVSRVARYVDEKKIGIAGGRTVVTWCSRALAFKPQEFAVGVDLFGVSNWVRTLQSIPPYWESFRKSLYKEIGDPSKDLENLRRCRPLFHADKIVKPLIVLQGANDPRVIKPESDEIVENIKKRNGVVEYVCSITKGHGFTKKGEREPRVQSNPRFSRSLSEERRRRIAVCSHQ
jgi:dipeptidyl aminopeptidase/acylaminoacyl peptidase